MRTALASSEIVRTEALEMLAIRRFERMLDRDAQIKSETSVGNTVVGSRPFASVSPAELSKKGYVTSDTTGDWTFLAADASVLLSEEFAADHCFAIVSGTGMTS